GDADEAHSRVRAGVSVEFATGVLADPLDWPIDDRHRPERAGPRSPPAEIASSRATAFPGHPGAVEASLEPKARAGPSEAAGSAAPSQPDPARIVPFLARPGPSGAEGFSARSVRHRRVRGDRPGDGRAG